MNLPIGQSKTKSNFFHEIAQAFDFLSLWYQLTNDEQEDLQQTINKFYGKVASRRKEN